MNAPIPAAPKLPPQPMIAATPVNHPAANPDLLNPTSSSPGAVSPVAAITQPLPVEAVEPNYYICTVPAASFFRKDGKKIPFVNGFCETDQKYDILYLEEEIALGSNPYLRRATKDEIHAHKMRKDPRAVISAEIEADLRQKLEKELREKITAELAGKNLIAGVDAAPTSGTVQGSNVTAAPVSVTATPVVAKLAGIASTANAPHAAGGPGTAVKK